MGKKSERVGQSFPADAAKALNDVLRCLELRKDPSVVLRSKAYQRARKLVASIAERADDASKRRRPKSVVVDGQSMSILQAARSLGICATTAYERVRKHGDVTKSGPEPERVTFRGELLTLSAIAKAIGISRESVRIRIDRGISLEAPPMTRAKGRAA